jgi:plasmid maintenance system killer protein
MGKEKKNIFDSLKEEKREISLDLLEKVSTNADVISPQEKENDPKEENSKKDDNKNEALKENYSFYLNKTIMNIVKWYIANQPKPSEIDLIAGKKKMSISSFITEAILEKLEKESILKKYQKEHKL